MSVTVAVVYESGRKMTYLIFISVEQQLQTTDILLMVHHEKKQPLLILLLIFYIPEVHIPSENTFDNE